jgi:glycosyltransferase involved in cell wall biosynthesis
MADSNTEARKAGADVDVLFIGGVLPRDEEAQVIESTKGSVDLAANALQWNLLVGLDGAIRVPVTLLNAVFVRTFPRFYRHAWVKGRSWSHVRGAQDESVGFLNLFGVKHAWRAVAVARRARRWVAARTRGTRAIVIYSMHAPFIVAGALAKRIDPRVRLCLIVPDLPEYMHLNERRSRWFALLKRCDRWVMSYFMRDVDCFVLLTKHMAGRVGVENRPWTVVEGVVNPDEAKLVPARASGSDERIVLYTGTLTKAYGIVQLLQAFELIQDPNYRLWICGAGEAEPEVRSMAARDPRVRYFGQTSRSFAMDLQRQATVLVNPRGDAEEFAKYSFPSKIVEYMLSGTPTIVRRLSGIPNEYYEHLLVVDGESTADLTKAITTVCAMCASDRTRWGARAQEFVIRMKNVDVQAASILNLILTS